ncbi:hypothetical protein N9H60_02040 [Flavimaricola sp.]|nr:hypothetical protein [Flavimaricola sp.]
MVGNDPDPNWSKRLTTLNSGQSERIHIQFVFLHNCQAYLWLLRPEEKLFRCQSAQTGQQVDPRNQPALLHHAALPSVHFEIKKDGGPVRIRT